MTISTTDRPGQASAPEDLFVDLFAEVFGAEKAQLLAHEYPFQDIYGGGRFIDYALRTLDSRIAFEIDGLEWHLPGAAAVSKFEDDLLRQNSLIHLGWQVYRWTDRQILAEPERVKEELAKFLESIPNLVSFDDFLPRQRGELVELRQHQEDALASLAAMRAEGKSIALLYHAQGAGKTIVAIEDARRVGGRTLFLAHRQPLVRQAAQKFEELWPEKPVGLFMAGDRDTSAFNIAASIQSVSQNLTDFAPDDFQYVVIDEAHHATAETYRRVLGYFRPVFTLGLTATPDRADGQSALELFRDCAHRLTLREAVQLGALVPIRCVRVRTNIDLSRVRFNQIQYNRRDLEQNVIVPGRDRLIVDTYHSHVSGRKAVAFCANVRHGEDVAKLFRDAGVPAQAVSGRLPRDQREQTLQQFHEGKLRVLCACDILNEGWDCPDVEVLLMARPTLSKVIYLQQLGRGTRKAEGKDCLIVFDFVDNASRYNQALSLHRALDERQYRPGALVLAPDHLKQQEAEQLARGEKPEAILQIGVWARDFEPVDVFNWQEAVAGMLSTAELDWKLAATEGTVRRAVERGLLTADHCLQVGDRTYHYFAADKVEQIRQALGLPEVNAQTIKGLFLDFVREMDMSASYKPVMLLAVLDSVDANGRAELAAVTRWFRQFYLDRKAAGLPVEKSNMRMARAEELRDSEVTGVMLEMPFRKFEQRHFLRYDRDLAYVRFEANLWRQLDRADVEQTRRICQQSIQEYYGRLSPGNSV